MFLKRAINIPAGTEVTLDRGDAVRFGGWVSAMVNISKGCRGFLIFEVDVLDTYDANRVVETVDSSLICNCRRATEWSKWIRSLPIVDVKYCGFCGKLLNKN